MFTEKYHFLNTQFLPMVGCIKADTKPLWGKMNAQQIVEHLASFFQVSTQKLHFPMVTPPAHLPKLMAFLWSDKPFRENTKAPVLPEEPLPNTHPNLDAALSALAIETQHFFSFFENEKAKKTEHPVFGELNFEEWVLLHHKHVSHHLRQFGLLG